MNQDGADVLIRAHLDGVPQVRHTLSDGRGGFCAMGLLLAAEATERSHGDAMCAMVDMLYDANWDSMRARYAISQEEHQEIVHANNYRRWDFLTIARKFVKADEVPS